MNDKVETLKKKVIENKGILPYINLNEKNEYVGWVSDFHFKFDDGNQMYLDLKKDSDMFLIFVLAVAWSRSGRWENAAYFVAYLKHYRFDTPEQWMCDSFVENQKRNRRKAATELSDYCVGMESRVKIGFRVDIYDSVVVLAQHWGEILSMLSESSQKSDYNYFIEYMRNISGLGVGNKKMSMKILLILRELRCQSIYENIPGELCCVPDARVKNACKKLNISLPVISTTRGLVKASTILYQHFGDLYDIPPFAYEDLMTEE
jgi:hypothetical protein